MLMVYVPAEKLLIESDLFAAAAPGAAASKNQAGDNALPAQLLANIKRLRLDVDRIVPSRGPALRREPTSSAPLGAAPPHTEGAYSESAGEVRP
jgi:hypothetical protein